MKPIKLIKKILKHEFENGQLFDIIEDGNLDQNFYLKYYYDSEYDIHSLYLVEQQLDNFGVWVVINENELPSSMLINDDINYILRNS